MQDHRFFSGAFTPTPRAIRLCLLASALAATLGACASTRDLPPREATIVSNVDAMIVPPPGGPSIINVVSTTFPNAIRQEISLATQARTVGENKITIVQFTDKGGDGSDARLKDIPFTQVNLTEEALAAWPNTGMAVSPYYVQNEYGPFGYAIGRPENGDACIYAWQRIEPTTRPSGSIDRGTITVRLQLCRRDAGEQELLEVMYRLRLKGSIFSPAPAPAAIGHLAAPIRPVGAEGFAQVIEMPAPAITTRQTPTVQPPTTPPVVVAPTVIVPQPGTPIVPSPGTTTTRSTGPIVPRPTTATTVIVPSPSSSMQQ